MKLTGVYYLFIVVTKERFIKGQFILTFMADKVYIGHGTRIEAAYRLALSTALHLELSGNLKRTIFRLAAVNADINRELNPGSVFVLVEDAAKRLRGHVCGNSKDEKFDTSRSQVLEAPEFNPLREYLATAQGDRVVAIQDSLADRVDGIVRDMGYEPVHFA